MEADGFLYNMVRAIAGTLMHVGRGFWPEAQVAEVLNAMDRSLAGPTAPPEGLFLMRVTYEPHVRRDLLPPNSKSPRWRSRRHATVTVPGSKSITNRALVLAALASRWTDCDLTGALAERRHRGDDRLPSADSASVSQPTGTTIDHHDRHAPKSDRIIPAESADLFVANSGTTMRFLTAMVSLGHGALPARRRAADARAADRGPARRPAPTRRRRSERGRQRLPAGRHRATGGWHGGRRHDPGGRQQPVPQRRCCWLPRSPRATTSRSESTGRSSPSRTSR